MPKGTRVHRCVYKLADKYGYSGAIAICQTSTRQNYMTGKRTTRRTGRRKRKTTFRSRKRRTKHRKHPYRKKTLRHSKRKKK